jgi:hypothetical protein
VAEPFPISVFLCILSSGTDINKAVFLPAMGDQSKEMAET